MQADAVECMGHLKRNLQLPPLLWPLRNFTVNGAIVYCPFKDQKCTAS